LLFVLVLLLYPEPELARGSKYMVKAGLVAVDPRKVTSGSTRQTNEKLLPSSKSNSAEVIKALIATALLVELSFVPDSWYISLFTVLSAAIGKWLITPESAHAVRAIVP
jgi:hypothetical protein